jgi:hypothetical protein
MGWHEVTRCEGKVANREKGDIWRKKCAATNLGDSLVGAINVGLGRNTVSKKVISVLDRPA